MVAQFLHLEFSLIEPHEQDFLHNIRENGFDNILKIKYNNGFYTMLLIMLLRIL